MRSARTNKKQTAGGSQEKANHNLVPTAKKETRARRVAFFATRGLVIFSAFSDWCKRFSTFLGALEQRFCVGKCNGQTEISPKLCCYLATTDIIFQRIQAGRHLQHEKGIE